MNAHIIVSISAIEGEVRADLFIVSNMIIKTYVMHAQRASFPLLNVHRTVRVLRCELVSLILNSLASLDGLAEMRDVSYTRRRARMREIQQC